MAFFHVIQRFYLEVMHLGYAYHLRYFLLMIGFLGMALMIWSVRVNPKGGQRGPTPIPQEPIKVGPYRYIKHPMYVSQWMMVTFFMWYAAGFWAAFAISTVAELLFREWIWRENGSPVDAHEGIGGIGSNLKTP